MKTCASIVLCLALAAVPVVAEEEAPESPWAGEAGLSFVATSGNTDTQTLGLTFKLDRTPDPWGWELRAAFLTAEQNGEKTAEKYEVGARALRGLNERWDLFGGLSGEKNEFAGFDLRAVAEAGATYKALLGPEHNLSFDGGLTWTTEDYVDGGDDNYLGAILGLAYKWQFSETASFSQRLIWYPNFEESGDWDATSETALQASLNSRLALKLGYLVRYYNEPLEGFDDTDTTATASVVLSF